MFQRTISVIPSRVGSGYAARTSRLPASRLLHSSPIASKTTTEKVAEIADKANKSVGQGLASAIETGEQVAEEAKETIGATKDRAEEKTKEATNSTAEKASEVASKGKKATESLGEKH